MKKRIIMIMVLLGNIISTQGQVLIQATGSSNNFNVKIGANFGGQYQSGHMFCFISNQTITGPATLAINGMSPQSILKNLDQPLTSGEIVNGQSVCVIYDGTNFQLNSPTIPTFVVTSSTGWVTTTFGLVYNTGGNILVSNPGNIGTGTTYEITQTGTNTHFWWYPRKGALSIGRPGTSSWSDVNIGNYSFRGGNDSRASGNTSFSFGLTNTSSGTASSALGGQNNTAAGQFSGILGGELNNSTGRSTGIIGGVGLVAPSYGEVAIGTYNTNYTPTGATSFQSTDRAFSIGIGPSSGGRSNAMTVFKNGNIGLSVDDPTATLDINGTVKLRNFTTPGILSTDNTGQIQLISACGFNVYRSNDQTLTSSVIGIIDFDAIQHNDGNAFNLATDEFTAPSNGIYQFSAKIMVKDIGQVDLMLYLNSSVIEQTSQFFPLGTSGNNSLSINTTIKLNSGDKITLRALQITASNQVIKNINNATIRFSGSRLY